MFFFKSGTFFYANINFSNLLAGNLNMFLEVYNFAAKNMRHMLK